MKVRPRSPSRGRPLKGGKKRLRSSFTLDPDQFYWLKDHSAQQKISMSDALGLVIANAQKQLGEDNRLFVRLATSQSAIDLFCKKFGIKRLSLFGSVLTDRFSEESDIDVLVEFVPEKRPGIFEITVMESELGRLFGGRRVDLKTEKELSRYFRDEVLRESEILFAA